MKISHRTLPAALALGLAVLAPAHTLIAAPASAVAGAPAGRDNRNAALYYWRAFYTLDREFQKKSSDYLDDTRTADWVPSADALTGLSENGAFVRQLLEASRIDKCDFGIAYEEGYMALLPHLGVLRSSARILVLDAHRLMSEGKADEAAERIAAIYRMAAHLRSDNVLISSLVSIAMASLAGTEAEMFAKAGKLTDAGRAVIISALQPMNQADGFGTKHCIDMERRIMIDYLRRNLKGPEAGKKLFEVGIIEARQEDKDAIMVLDEAGVGTALGQMEGAYREILGAWDAPDYEKSLARVQEKLEQKEYGPLAQVLTPALGRAKSSDVKAMNRLREVLQILTDAKYVPAEDAPKPN